MWNERLILHLNTGNVDRQRQLNAVLLPVRQDTAGLFQHPVAEGHDHAQLFRERDNVGRQGIAAVILLPTQQRFGANHLVGLHVDLRLQGTA